MGYNYRGAIPPPKPAKKDLWKDLGWDYVVVRCILEPDITGKLGDFWSRSYLFDEDWIELEKLIIMDSCKKMVYLTFNLLNKSPIIAKT